MFLLLSSILIGCTGNSQKELAASSAITFSTPGFHLASGSTITWRSDLVYLFDDPRERPENITPFLQREIQSNLEARGIVFAGQGEAVIYGLVAVVVLGDGMTAKDVLQQFRLTPSFKASRRYEKGTIVIAIYNAGDETVLWRGAIQSNVDLEMAPEQRRRLVREHVGRLLSKIPSYPPD